MNSSIVVQVTSDGLPAVQIMTFLFADFTDTDWKQYFDVIIVDARKPLFFAGGVFNESISC